MALAAARRRRARGDPGAPAVPGRADAAVDADEGRQRPRTTSSLRLVVDAELFRLDSVVRWLDAADARLERTAADGQAAAGASRRCRSGDGAIGVRAMSAAGAAGRCPRSTARALPRCTPCDGVDLSVDEGELVAVMGPSGSGKSTLLTIAGSLEEPTDGEVLVRGAELAAMSRNDKARLRRRTIGFVFQDFNLLAGLTAAENVSLPLELDGLPARKAPSGRRWRRWRSWGWPSGPSVTRTSCRAANGSGWPSPAPWSESAGCCWPTSPPARSTRATPRRSCAWCTARARTAGWPRSWSPTTHSSPRGPTGWCSCVTAGSPTRPPRHRVRSPCSSPGRPQ